MIKYKVECRIAGEDIEKYIECREMTIKEGSYCFWTGELGATNRLAWAFPIMFTIVEGLPDSEEI